MPKHHPHPTAAAAPSAATKKAVAAKPTGDVYLCISVAVSGRCPLNGNILSIGAAAVTQDRELLGTFSQNMLPLPGAERLVHPDVLGFWQAKRSELEQISGDAVPAAEAMANFLKFCKPFGRCTLVGSPLLSSYGWLTHYWNALMPPRVAMPWGFSGLCLRSFAAGFYGVSMQNLLKHQPFLDAHEGWQADGVPRNDAVVAAVLFSNVLRQSLRLDPVPVRWVATSSVPVVPLPQQQSPAALSKAVPSVLSDATTTTDAITQVSSLPFAEYPSISNPVVDLAFHAQAVALSEAAADSGASHQVEWVVTEKVHGSNFSIITDGAAFACAKRTSLLAEGDNSKFFYYDRIVDKLKPAALKAHALVIKAVASEATTSPTVVAVAFIGELAGGEYVHPNVPFDLRGIKVQSGVQYHPNNFFYAFDIAYATKLVPGGGTTSTAAAVLPTAAASASDASDAVEWTFLPFDDALSIFDACGIFCARPLFRGQAQEALQFDPILETTIPRRFGLASIPGNYAEGVVARPVKDLFANGCRVVAKLKHPDFSEFARTPGDSTPDELLLHFAKNMNRWASVTSKMTTEEKGNEARVAQLAVGDALADVKLLHPSFELSDEARATVEAAVRLAWKS